MKGGFTLSLTFNPYNYTKVEQVKEHLGVQLIDILVNVEEKTREFAYKKYQI